MHSVCANMGGGPMAMGMDGYANQRTTTAIISIPCTTLARVERDVV